jgi:hypothetical protein
LQWDCCSGVYPSLFMHSYTREVSNSFPKSYFPQSHSCPPFSATIAAPRPTVSATFASHYNPTAECRIRSRAGCSSTPSPPWA